MWRLLRIALVIFLSRFCVSQPSCPSFASLSPPSGFMGEPFLLTGENLDAVADVTVTSNFPATLDVAYATVSSESIQINFTTEDQIFSNFFPATVTLSPVNVTNCSDVVVPDIMLYTQRECFISFNTREEVVLNRVK